MYTVHVEFERQCGQTQHVITIHNVLPEVFLALYRNNACQKRLGELTLTFRAANAVHDRRRYLWRPQTGLTPVPNPPALANFGIEIGTLAGKQERPKGIVFLLESPHEDETTAGGEPLWPAIGSTGEAISNNLERLHALLIQVYGTQISEPVPFSIVNPLPLPASCRISTTAWGWWKQAVFHALWQQVPEFKQGFELRLEQYNPQIILNAVVSTPVTTGPAISLRQASPLNVMLQPGGTVQTPWTPTPPATHVGPAVTAYAQTEQRQVHHAQVRASPRAGGFVNRQQSNPLPTVTNSNLVVIDIPHPSAWRFKRP